MTHLDPWVYQTNSEELHSPTNAPLKQSKTSRTLGGGSEGQRARGRVDRSDQVSRPTLGTHGTGRLWTSKIPTFRSHSHGAIPLSKLQENKGLRKVRLTPMVRLA